MVALFGTDLNAAGMNTIVGYIYDMLYGNSGGFPSYASAAAVILFIHRPDHYLHQPDGQPVLRRSRKKGVGNGTAS